MREKSVCKGRIQGEYPIFLPSGFLFSERLVSYAHLSTHCGWSGFSMAKVREDYWIPRQLAKRFHKLAKRVIRSVTHAKDSMRDQFSSQDQAYCQKTELKEQDLLK
eukprot:gene13923-4875_t